MNLLPGGHLSNNNSEGTHEGSDGESQSKYSSSDGVSGLDAIYRKQDLVTVVTNILKIVVPAVTSSMLGQVTYVINFVEAGKFGNSRYLAGLGLGHAISQCLGIMIFLGLNSSLATNISQAYGL